MPTSKHESISDLPDGKYRVRLIGDGSNYICEKIKGEWYWPLGLKDRPIQLMDPDESRAITDAVDVSHIPEIKKTYEFPLTYPLTDFFPRGGSDAGNDKA